MAITENKKMKTLLAITFLPLLAGCISTNHISSTSGLNQSDLDAIPASAKEIYVTVPGATPQALHEQVVNILIARGHRIQREDKERLYVTTEGKDVGESTLQRMVITTTEVPNVGAVTKIVSEWRAGTSATMGASAFSGLAV